jgi:predicted P-loop ATPase
LDVDVKKGATGPATVATLCEVFGALPITVEAITGTGGRHLYFRHPLDGRTVPNKQSRMGLGSETWGTGGYPAVPFARAPNGQLVTPGLDVRGDGGYVILPGSVLAAGGCYTWAPGRDPESCPIATAPPWLLALVAVDPQAAPVPRAARGEHGQDRPPAAASSFFAKVNTKALAALPAWVPVLLPAARSYHDGFRVTSKALGRDLEEDLSIIPAGIQDWGEERGKTPIDLVLEWGSPTTPAEAALWLCRQIGIDPAHLGWRNRSPESAPRPAVQEVPPPLDPEQPLNGWAVCLDEHGMPVDAPTAPPPPSGPPPPPPADGGPGGPDEPAGRPPWADRLMYTDKGVIRGTAYNVREIIANVPEWTGCLAYCDFSQRIIARTDPPFANAARGEWTDAHDTELRHWLAERFRFEPKKTDIADAVLGVALANRFHPIRDYLDALVWDGRQRLHTWLQVYLGAGHARDDPGLSDTALAERDRYLSWVGTWWMIQSIARIRRPGCKADNVLILEGEQGVMKSTALKVLYSPDWFSDTRIDIGSKDAMLAMQGTWCIELAELDAMNKADMRTAKAYFSSSEDRFRVPYGHRLARFPRQSVMAGTTNQSEYLSDLTGNRRYWPVACGDIDIVGLGEVRDQLWAEAQMRFARGERWYAETDEEKAVLAEQQGDRVAGDVWEWRIQSYLARRLVGLRPEQRAQVFVTMDAIMENALSFTAKDMKKPEQTRVGMIVQALGWRNTRPRQDGERVRGYRPGPRALANGGTWSQTTEDEHDPIDF